MLEYGVLTLSDDLFARPILVFQNETGDLNGTTLGVDSVIVNDMTGIAEIGDRHFQR
jgi:hypothetical protein